MHARLDLQSALLYDCLLVVAYGVMAMDYSQGLDSRDRVSCAQEKVIWIQVLLNLENMFQPWEYGSSLFNYINSVQTLGKYFPKN